MFTTQISNLEADLEILRAQVRSTFKQTDREILFKAISDTKALIGITLLKAAIK